MTKSETLRLMVLLGAAFPGKELQKPTIEIYCESLADLPFRETEAAIKRLVRTADWFPTIAAIRREVVEASCDAPDPGEAWEEVWGALQRYGIARQLPAWSHPVVEKAVNALGYRNLYESENPAADRARFMDIYKGYREGYMRDQQTGALPMTCSRPALPEPDDDEENGR